MAHRHLARSVVIQTLFSFDFFNHSGSLTPSALVQYILRQFHKTNGNENVEFMADLVGGVLKKKTIIDEVLAKAAPEWPVDKINAVDRNILRLGLYELLFGDYEQVPPKVAINEAIELAKAFGSDSSSRFVNGVLGAVYKEIGEPGKDQKSRRQKMQIPFEDMPIDPKGGALVYAFNESGELYFAMVHDVFGYWTLSKSGVRDFESTQEEAAKRAVKEEMGLFVEVKDQIGENEYVAFHPEDGPVRKQVKYFLAQSVYVPFKLEDTDGGLDDARWFSAAEVVDLTMYDDVTGLIAKSVGTLLQR